MKWLRPRRPSPAVVISLIALFVALGGVGYAATSLPKNSVGTKQLKKNAVTGPKIKKNAVTGRKIKKNAVNGGKVLDNSLTGADINESTLGTVPHAANADNLQGQPASSFVPASKVFRFSFKLAFGSSQDIVTAGPFTLTARCIQNGTDDAGNPNQDIARIVISTSQDGAVFDGLDSKRGDTGAGSFLDTSTPETDRVFTELANPTGTPFYDAESNTDGSAYAADGTSLSLSQDGVGLAVGEFGTGCIFHGFGVIDS